MQKLAKLRAERKRLLVELLGSVCQGDCCFEVDIKLLHFDHIDPNTKCFDISKRLAEYSIERLISETKKCRLLCRTCHHRRSLRDGHYGRHHCVCAVDEDEYNELLGGHRNGK